MYQAVRSPVLRAVAIVLAAAALSAVLGVSVQADGWFKPGGGAAQGWSRQLRGNDSGGRGIVHLVQGVSSDCMAACQRALAAQDFGAIMRYCNSCDSPGTPQPQYNPNPVRCGSYSCPAGSRCGGRRRACYPEDSIDCGNGFCAAGNVCTADQMCMRKEDAERLAKEELRKKEELIAGRKQAIETHKTKEEEQKKSVAETLRAKVKEAEQKRQAATAAPKTKETESLGKSAKQIESKDKGKDQVGLSPKGLEALRGQQTFMCGTPPNQYPCPSTTGPSPPETLAKGAAPTRNPFSDPTPEAIAKSRAKQDAEAKKETERLVKEAETFKPKTQPNRQHQYIDDCSGPRCHCVHSDGSPGFKQRWCTKRPSGRDTCDVDWFCGR